MVIVLLFTLCWLPVLVRVTTYKSFTTIKSVLVVPACTLRGGDFLKEAVRGYTIPMHLMALLVGGSLFYPPSSLP